MFNPVIIVLSISSKLDSNYISSDSDSDSDSCYSGIAIRNQQQFNENFYRNNVEILNEQITALNENYLPSHSCFVLAVHRETHAVTRFMLKHWGEKNELATQNCYFFHVTFNTSLGLNPNGFTLTRFSKKDEDTYPVTAPPQEITKAVSYLFKRLE